MCCNLCKKAEQDISAYKEGYGKKYPPNIVDQIQELRNELCMAKDKCSCSPCMANDLIAMLDSDADIQRKKGKI